MAKKTNGQTTREELVKALAEEIPQDKPSSELDESAKALAALEKERQRRAECFKDGLEKLCVKWKCELVPQIVLFGNQTKADVIIVAQ